ncbi:MAG: hypothetical protein QM477_11225 [Planctomycetota bacterium]
MTGVTNLAGEGSLAGTIPASLSGSTVYLEVGSMSGALVYDSNMIVLVVR